MAPVKTQIYVMRADGWDVRRVTQGETSVGGASWSPDGKALAFFEAVSALAAARPDIPRPLAAVSQIGRVDSASGARTALMSGSGSKLTPQWLPDGRIAYLRSDAKRRCRLVLGKGVGAGGVPITGRKEFVSRMAAMGPRASSPECSGAPTKSGLSSIVSWKRRRRRYATVFSMDPQFRLVRTGTLPS